MTNEIAEVNDIKRIIKLFENNHIEIIEIIIQKHKIRSPIENINLQSLFR